MNILILGPVGSGKSTQADLLSQELGIPHLSAGDLVHYFSESTDPRANEVREKMQKGELIDDRMMVSLMEEHLKQSEHKNGTIIDGFPRNVKEAEMFLTPIEKVIYLKLSDEEVTKRLNSRGREDDTPEVIQNRIKIYHDETEPLLNYYRQKGIVVEIDGNRSIEEIAKDIRKLFS